MLPDIRGPNIAGNVLGQYMRAKLMQNALAEQPEPAPAYNVLARHGGPTRAAAAEVEASGGMSAAALAAHEALAQAWGRPLKVNSAYRSPEHNARVGGAKHSQHMSGNAYDYDVSDLPLEMRLDLIRLARENGFQGIGVYDNSLHFDVGPARHWGPDYSSGSTPSWALPALG